MQKKTNHTLVRVSNDISNPVCVSNDISNPACVSNDISSSIRL